VASSLSLSFGPLQNLLEHPIEIISKAYLNPENVVTHLYEIFVSLLESWPNVRIRYGELQCEGRFMHSNN